MTSHTKQVLNEALKDIPNIEPVTLTDVQKTILEFLKNQKTPRLTKTISEKLGLNYNSTRARLSELLSMGFVYQPNKGSTIADLNGNGLVNLGLNDKKCGYLALETSQG